MFEALKSYLKSHPNILHMCYLPIHAAMVAFVFQKTGKIPKTETEIYKHFTCLTLMRNLSKSGKCVTIDADLCNLNGEEQLCFKQICGLAFEKTVLRKQVLQQNEVSSCLKVRRNNIDTSLGLITVDRIADLYGFKDLYTFMHLTFQEYLAAYHLFTVSDEEQTKLIQEHGDKNHMLIVWKFYCGLVEIKAFENKFKSVLHNTKGSTLYYIQCAYESQQKIACVQLLKDIHYHIELTGDYLSTPDFTAIGYVTNTTIISTKLSFVNCNLNVEAIDALVSEMGEEARRSICGLHIETRTVDIIQMKCIKKLLASLGSLKHISIYAKLMTSFISFPKEDIGCDLSDLTVLSLVNIDIGPLLQFSDLTLDKLTTIRFKGDDKGFKTIVGVLRHSKNITDIDVSCNNIGKDGAKLLSKYLKFCNNIKRINISNNNIPSSEITAILKNIRHCNLEIKATEITDEKDGELIKYLEELINMQSLELSITKQYFSSFCISCKRWKNLKTLNLTFSHSPIIETAYTCCFEHLTNLQALTLKYDVQGATSLMDGLSHCANLQKLDLSNNRICFEEIEVIATSLAQFTSLKELHLNINWIGDDGAKTISSCLQYYQSLEELSLSNNKISSIGGKALFNNLHHCSKLKKLDLSCNNIDDEAAHLICLHLNPVTCLNISQQHTD